MRKEISKLIVITFLISIVSGYIGREVFIIREFLRGDTYSTYLSGKPPSFNSNLKLIYATEYKNTAEYYLHGTPRDWMEIINDSEYKKLNLYQKKDVKVDYWNRTLKGHPDYKETIKKEDFFGFKNYIQDYGHKIPVYNLFKSQFFFLSYYDLMLKHFYRIITIVLVIYFGRIYVKERRKQVHNPH